MSSSLTARTSATSILRMISILTTIGADELFRYHGGHYKMFPVRIVVPSSDYWNVTIDLGGGRANIQYDISFIKAAA